jgi:BlaI family transcriptional regulator, penicillinase repressor
MPRPKFEMPTPAEMRALLFLHKHGPATVREYLKDGGLHEEGRAYTSVMSLMNVLHEKGYATRKEEGRAFRYAPVITKEELQASALQFVLNHAFAGSVEEMKSAVSKLEAPSKRKK